MTPRDASRQSLARWWPLALSLALLAGCASYYKVTDTITGKDYYTRDFEREGGGHVVFKDGRTGNEVTLQSSEVQEINKEMYKSNVAKP